MCCPWVLARLRPSAVWVRIKSRSTSASPPSTASIKRAVLVPVSAHGLGQRAELRLGVHDALDSAEQVEGAVREAVDSRRRHHVAGGQLAVFLPRPRAGRQTGTVIGLGRGGDYLSGSGQSGIRSPLNSGENDETSINRRRSCGHTGCGRVG
jgi:hypothetical protein